MSIKIAMAYFFKEHEKQVDLAKQLGATHVVASVSGAGLSVDGDDRPWEWARLSRTIKSYEERGLTVSVIEGPTPLDRAKLDLPGKDQEIEVFQKFLGDLGRLGVRTVCYNWMPIVGWFRTEHNLESRGGARVTAYRDRTARELPLTEAGIVPAERMWNNLEYFLKAVVPYAEAAGVRLAIHPDDPPVPSLRGIARVLINRKAFQRVIDMVPSMYNGITMCQGSFAAMGENIPELISAFGEQGKIFFAHFRDIRGTAYDFTETFHDDGQTDMYECMKRYYKIGYDGCMRPDHVPAMAGEENENPGYSILGNLFAIGYMKGLMEAAGRECKGLA